MGRRTEHLQIGQQAHKKMFSINNHQGNANQVSTQPIAVCPVWLQADQGYLGVSVHSCPREFPGLTPSRQAAHTSEISVLPVLYGRPPGSPSILT